MAKKLTSTKAREILHDKEVHGHPLTEQQRKFFGAIAGGAKPYKAESGGWLDKYDTPQAQTGTEVIKGKDFVDQWMKSPMYKEMLEKSAQGPELERISKGRIASFNVPTNVSRDINLEGTGTLGQTQHRVRTMLNATGPEYEEMMKIMQKSIDNPKDKEAKRRADEVIQPMITGWNIGLNPKLKPGTIDYEATLAHEYGHTTDNPFVSKFPYQMSRKEAINLDTQTYIPKSDIEKMKAYSQGKVNDDLTKYVSKPQETRQYLNDIRYLGKSQGVYDPFSEKITTEQFKKIQPLQYGNPMQTLRQVYTDEQIIDMLNSISKTQRANDIPVAQNGIEGTMGGLTDIGFNYNGAWGGPSMQDGGNLIPPMAGANTSVSMAQLGDSVKPVPMQLAMGGSMPGAVGFTYARTVGAAPANGPYAKKTKASAQNGQEMKYYQEGLDFTPKTISQDGSRTPIYVSDPNDPRLKAYQDSLSLYKGYRNYDLDKTKPIEFYDKNDVATLRAMYPNTELIERKPRPLSSYDQWVLTESGRKTNFKVGKTYSNKELALEQNKAEQYANRQGRGLMKNKGNLILDWKNQAVRSSTIAPIGMGYGDMKDIDNSNAGLVTIYKKPVQPVVLEQEPRFEKPIPIPRDTRDLGYTLPTPGQPRFPELYKYSPDTPTKFSFTSPTGGYNQQKTMYFPSKSALKSFTEGVRGATYQEGADYATATGNLQDGGDIPVDPMGYWNPENVGNPVTIPSNIITMEGVDQPLLGISDTGDVQYMEPGEDYEFDGEYVTEYPVAQKGKTIPAPTTADSARLYNAQIALNKFYENEMKAGRIKKSRWSDSEVREFPTSPTSPTSLHPEGLRKANLDFYRGEIKRREKYSTTGNYDDVYKKVFNLSPEQVKQLEYKGLGQTKGGSEYQDYYRDLITPMQNLAAPFALVDYRIRPQRQILYEPTYKNSISYPGENVQVYDYDPLAIKPYHMRTPKEKIEWEKKYGKKETTKTKPTPPPTKKKTVTSTPEAVRQTIPPAAIPSSTSSTKSVSEKVGMLDMFGKKDVELLVDNFGNYEWFRKDDDIGDLKPIRRATREEIEYSKKQKQRNGGVNSADAQPIEKLDQLLNFTNYNKPTKGGWLDKYK